MGNRNNRARIFVEEALQPCYGFGIKVVGGFIEQQHVGLREQQAAECDTATLASRQLGYIRIPGWQAQCIGGHFELAVDLPAAGRVDGILQLALFFEQRVHFIV